MSSKVFAAIAFALSLSSAVSTVEARPNRPMTVVHPRVTHPRVAMMGTLKDGRVATVYTDGRAIIAPPRIPSGDSRASLKAHFAAPMSHRTVQVGLSSARYGSLTGAITAPQRRQILFDLEYPPQPYIPGRVIVAFKPGVTIPQDTDALTPEAAQMLRTAIGAKRHDISPHPFTTDARANLTLMRLGVDRTERLFSKVDRGTLGSMRARAEARAGHPLVPFDNAFVLHVGASSVSNAVRTLRTLPAVTYVSPDFAVDSMISQRNTLPPATVKELSGLRRPLRTFGRSTKSTVVTTPTIPTNTAVSFNLQALLNAPGVDAVAAFDEIGQRFSQLPGTGEIITNVGLGDADDASAGLNPNDPCYDFVSGTAGTTHLIGGQRYLDFPSLPLIPVWVSDENGNLSPTAEVCGVDPQLAEVGLDFSVMAPLPDNVQRSGETDTTGADLLGIAPGASFRWVAPGATGGSVGTSDVLGAFIGAARQVPAPNVITASIGFGYDGDGFPARYLEDDPLSESVIAAVVSANIVVCIAANDGTRDFTSAAIGPSGGSAATNIGTTTTSVADIGFTTAPSIDADSGAIDIGASTLDDITAANPQNPAFANLANTKAFSETRFDGELGFSSGFGSRVNVSAPGDNVESLFLVGPSYDGVSVGLVGGTSASAPETAAAAAVALQVARLSGHPLTNASQVRGALAATGTPVANPPQSDVPLNVGPQIDVRKVVEQLLAAAGKPIPPGIARVAVQGRRSGSFIAFANERYLNDVVFVTTLDPTYIKLDGPFTMPGTDDALAFPGSDTAADLNSYLTIAPDWEGIPANATYRLAVAGQPSRVIATTPYARMLPAQLFAAAGVSLAPGTSRTLSLTYSASVALHNVAESTFQLTFGPPATSSRLALAPTVPPVVSGTTIPVTYDVRSYPRQLLGSPTLNVSMPGNASHQLAEIGLYPYYSVPLSALTGTVNVPVNALAGAGTYTIWIDFQPGTSTFPSDISDLAFTRVDAGTARPPAPLLSLGAGNPAVHTLDVPYKTKFTVSYDVSHVPAASGAIIELGAPPPSAFYVNPTLLDVYNTFRNPNGSSLDDNGVVTGSLYHLAASGVTGSVTIDPTIAAIPPTATVNVRVLPTAGGTPIAEAGDAGTITYHGIDSALGGALDALFIDPNGSDGYMGESGDVGPLQANLAVYTTEPFDLTTGTNNGVSIAFTNNETGAYPIVQNDVALTVDTLDFTTINYYRAMPLSAGFLPFAFPSGSLPSTAILSAVASNSSSLRSAYLAIDFASGSFLATRGDIATGSGFSAGIDVTAYLEGAFGFDQATNTFAYDPNADRAYILVENDNVACNAQSPQLVTIDFATASVTSRALPIDGGDPEFGDYGYQMALDPATHIAAIATSCQFLQGANYAFRSQLSLLDLNAGVTTQVFERTLGIEQLLHGTLGMVGGASAVIGIDPVNHVVLQRSMYCPNLVGPYDLNARPCLDLYGESGRLAKTVPNLFPASFLDGSTRFNGVNGTTHMGVAMGQQPGGSSIESFGVQPYSY
jgi:hypothetical protein